jgi:predicted nucleic acid-binding Zn ribbon protein
VKRVGNLLSNALEKEVLRVAKAQGVLKRWDEIVGPGLAERSWPDRYERSVVWVAVQGSAWAQELRLMKEVILSRLRERVNEPDLFADVRFGVRKLQIPEERVQSEPAPPPDQGALSIKEIAEKRLKSWKDAPRD